MHCRVSSIVLCASRPYIRNLVSVFFLTPFPTTMAGFQKTETQRGQNLTAQDTRFVPLEVDSTRFLSGEVDVPNTVAGGAFTWEVYVFHEPRPAKMRMFWTASCMYKYYRMTQYKGNASAWCSRSKAGWAKLWQHAFGSSQLVEGTTITGKNKAKSELPFMLRCLPEPSISTLGIISLAQRFGEDPGA